MKAKPDLGVCAAWPLSTFIGSSLLWNDAAVEMWSETGIVVVTAAAVTLLRYRVRVLAVWRHLRRPWVIASRWRSRSSVSTTRFRAVVFGRATFRMSPIKGHLRWQSVAVFVASWERVSQSIAKYFQWKLLPLLSGVGRITWACRSLLSRPHLWRHNALYPASALLPVSACCYCVGAPRCLRPVERAVSGDGRWKGAVASIWGIHVNCTARGTGRHAGIVLELWRWGIRTGMAVYVRWWTNGVVTDLFGPLSLQIICLFLNWLTLQI